MLPLRFAVTASGELGDAAFTELRAAIVRADGPDVAPLFLPDYNSLHEAVHLQVTDVAWCPPLVARDLLRVDAAEPIVTVERGGADHYYSAIVVRSDSPLRLAELGTSRFGWVSRLSAAGYIVPRRYLSSIGVNMARADERFLKTHAELAKALLARRVDTIATYAARTPTGFRLPEALRGERILGTAGPIPGDVIVFGRRSDALRARELGVALRRVRVAPFGSLAQLLNATGFGAVGFHHFDALARWFDPSKAEAQHEV
jgi:ABC-type phosphate/phosphonate transport system substrate-binding protein